MSWHSVSTEVCEPCDGQDERPAKVAKTGSGFFFSRGPGTFRVAERMHEEARAKLVAALKAACAQAGGPATGVVLLRGGTSTERYDTDHEELFRQESYFAYLFGVEEPDW